MRRTAELLRSWMGKLERYLFWLPLAEWGPPESERCHLSASTVHRWLDQAGIKAQESVEGQLEGIVDTKSAGLDGLWAKLRGGGKRVVLMLTDSVTGIVFPPIIAKGEESAEGFRQLFARVELAGLDLEQLRGVPLRSPRWRPVPNADRSRRQRFVVFLRAILSAASIASVMR